VTPEPQPLTAEPEAVTAFDDAASGAAVGAADGAAPTLRAQRPANCWLCESRFGYRPGQTGFLSAGERR
jgi:hypothetical protein